MTAPNITRPDRQRKSRHVPLRDLLRDLPPESMVPVGWILDRLDASSDHGIESPTLSIETEDYSWRTKLWTAPPQTRLGINELSEALGKPKSWIYRRTSEAAAAKNGKRGKLDMIPHRRLGGSLSFLVHEIRSWVATHEKVEVPGRQPYAKAGDVTV